MQQTGVPDHSKHAAKVGASLSGRKANRSAWKMHKSRQSPRPNSYPSQPATGRILQTSKVWLCSIRGRLILDRLAVTQSIRRNMLRYCCPTKDSALRWLSARWEGIRLRLCTYVDASHCLPERHLATAKNGHRDLARRKANSHMIAW